MDTTITTFPSAVYEGSDPYIFISCHNADWPRVAPVLDHLRNRGFRFWNSHGIPPGTEADEVIAEHIEGCEFFVAFLSGDYLGCLDTTDELNFSRDTNREYLLIYLDESVLPAGLDMRFLRAESIQAQTMSPEAVFSRLQNIESAPKFYGIADPALRPAAETLFAQLDKLYPWHQVFALDAVAKQLSKALSALYLKAGYESAEHLLRDYGFHLIGTEEARALRSSVVYQPGTEPEIVKTRIDHILSTLRADYPDGSITDNLASSHKSIYSSLLGLSVWLGYDSLADMLAAYGFTGLRSERGRTETDYNAVIATLTHRYAGKEKPGRMSTLLADNPDLRSALKTMTNRAPALFGMTLGQYFRQLGLIVPADKTQSSTKTALQRQEILEKIRTAYAVSDGSYGTYADAEETIHQLVLKQNRQGQIYISDCICANEQMRLPLAVDYIGSEAFAGQSDLRELILPPTVKEIRDSAFADCAGLETIRFCEGLEILGNGAFSGCTGLRALQLPASLLRIGNYAFGECAALSEITFRNLRVNIQDDAFEGCAYMLESLQDTVASPAEFFELKVDKKNTAKILAYTGDEKVVTVPGMIGGHPITAIEKGCFRGNDQIQEIYINDQISVINGDVFKDCVNLRKVHLPETVTKFTSAAFAGCTALEEVNIPDSMTDVPRGLFKDSPLTTVYIGKSATNLSPDAFYKGEADFASGLFFRKKVLENLIVDPGNPHFSAAGTCLLSKDGKRLIAELGGGSHAVIPEGVEEIGPQAFEKLGNLQDVSFPSTLKRIGDKAFAGTALTHVEFPLSLEVIGAEAFSYCRSLHSAELYDGIKVISRQAFAGCPIEDVYIPASVTELGSDSFVAISGLPGAVQKFRVDSANTALVTDGFALYSRSGDTLTLIKAYHPELRPQPGTPASPFLDYAVLPGTAAIADKAFALCSNLASVALPDGLQSIGDMAFWNCTGLTEIHIPESCVSVSPRAFFGINIQKI